MVIRPELPAQYIQQLPSIETLLTHLKGKGRKPATLEAIQKGLKALAIRTDLKNPSKVELAIARYTKQNGRPATNNYKSKPKKAEMRPQAPSARASPYVSCGIL